MTTIYLGSTTGLRRRGVQPTGRLELNGKSEAGGSAWVGRATRDFTDVDVAPLLAELSTRLGWGQRRIDLPPGRYETLLPPGPVADLMIYTYWTANARDAEEGRNVFAAPATAAPRSATGWPTCRSPCAPTRAIPGWNPCRSWISPPPPTATGWAFDAGSPIEPVDWIADGVHTELIRNRGQAARTGQRPTPPPDNLIMDGDPAAPQRWPR